MKTQLIFRTSILSLAILILGSFASCKKDEVADEPNNSSAETVSLPASNVTTYDGDLSYVPAAGSPILTNDGEATITQSGNTYTITFSDGVPGLSGLQFTLDDGEYATISSGSSLSGIVVDGNTIDIGVVKDGNNWSFAGSH